MVKIWLTVAPVLDMKKNWKQDWPSVGALFFQFIPKICYSKYVLDTLGDAHISQQKPLWAASGVRGHLSRGA
jgi:hypothetical protein